MNIASQNSLSVRINGEIHQISPCLNVSSLLESLRISQDEVAIELNKAVIRKRDWGTTPVPDKAEIEIVQFVGGG